MDGLDSPKAIIKGSYMEVRAFELAYRRMRREASSLMAVAWIAFGGVVAKDPSDMMLLS